MQIFYRRKRDFFRIFNVLKRNVFSFINVEKLLKVLKCTLYWRAYSCYWTIKYEKINLN